MKNVWILNHYAQEPGGDGGTRHYHLASHLKSFGWEATLIAASVEHSSGRQRLRNDELTRYEKIQGVPFLWIHTPTYKGNGKGRIINMMTYFWRTIKKKSTDKLPRPDVIIGSSVHPFAAMAGAILAYRHKVPFIFEVRDLWPQTLIDMGQLRENSYLTWALRKLEIFLYKRAARIITLLPNSSEYITQLGIPKERIAWIPNGVDLTLFPKPSPAKDSNESDFTLMYFGAHGKANDIENILHSMKYVQQHANGQKIRLRLIGNGPLKQNLIAQANDMKLTNISFEQPVKKSEIPKLAAQADAFVISVLDLPNLYRYGISMNKLFDYLAASRPIIISSNASNNPVAEAQAGITVSAGHPEDLANAILKLASTPIEARRQMGLSGRAYVENHHEFQQLSSQLANILNEVS